MLDVDAVGRERCVHLVEQFDVADRRARTPAFTHSQWLFAASASHTCSAVMNGIVLDVLHSVVNHPPRRLRVRVAQVGIQRNTVEDLPFAVHLGQDGRTSSLTGYSPESQLRPGMPNGSHVQPCPAV